MSNQKVGRFISADPLGYVDGPTVYAAFGNELVHSAFGWEDPKGQAAKTTTGPVVDYVNEMARERGFPERGPG